MNVSALVVPSVLVIVDEFFQSPKANYQLVSIFVVAVSLEAFELWPRPAITMFKSLSARAVVVLRSTGLYEVDVAFPQMLSA